MPEGTQHRIEYEGVYRTAVWVPDQSGSYRGREYFLAREVADRAKLRSLIERQCDIAVGIRDKTKFRHEGDGIWVFKRFQDRLFCYMDGKKVCITHGIRKKQDRLLPSEFVIARMIRDYNLS